VALFHTAPFGSEDNSLTDLVHWLMRAEGITPGLTGDQSARPTSRRPRRRGRSAPGPSSTGPTSSGH
jgi:hypothetical protein